MKNKGLIVVFLIIIIGVGIGLVLFLWLFPSQTSEYSYNVEIAFPNLSFTDPIGIYDADDASNRLFVVEQEGLIWVFINDKDVLTKEKFLDISDLILSGGERGLLGLTFHPNYETNGYFYVYYTKSGTGDSVVSRFKVNETNANLANKSSEFLILTVNQPFPNHNGGQISFGPDDNLYIALGDGGSSGDPSGHGQNRSTLLGSILRIDVDSGTPYNIPMDNPFYNNIDGYKEEIFAFGFRNPWRFSFDNETGKLWIADVGESSWEEIDIVESGKNYGWNTREGTHDFNPNSNVTELEPPIYEYANSGDNIAITGGFVYHGPSLISLSNKYIYADYGSGKIWALNYNSGVVIENELLIDTTFQISSFGIDGNSELYICSFDGNIYILSEIVS